ncbi:MAG: histidinol-phosphate transaminase [Treponema sp.]|uniref:histidinol-phosphate transaminase n=1 Tax=Treponema sp. TaxID=166 RepID=UPI0025CD19D4|nr:histidinol-phosphate transaminase [Treponema sp.]MBQ8678914.1 histidinol-phosphate transaminase [Treponema sp.]MBR1639255.1 histidinol-phosphate transaminase [Treponema sp.]
MLISSRVKNLHPYVPGEQPKDRDYIKLNANENPYPPSPEVSKALSSFIESSSEKLGLYPDPDSLELHAAIADMLNKTGGVLSRCSVSSDGSVCPAEEDKIPFTVTPDMIYSGNGSDEVLSFVFYAFFDSGKSFVMPEFTYSFYPVYAGFYNIPMDTVPLKEDWSLDVKEMLARSKKNKGGIIFANPNAPTGLSLTREEVRQMLLEADKDEIFIVDEAYVDFGGQSCIPLLSEFKNLVIVRTFSKSLCGAGQRLGYIVSSPELVNIVTTVKNSVNHFPIDVLAQVSGTAACRNPAYYVDCAKKVCSVRDDFYNFLLTKGFYAVESDTNFIFARHPKIGGADLYQAVKNDGILIRHFNTPGIEDFVRITVGTQKQMELLKESFNKITGGLK